MAAPLDTSIYLKERESLRIADGAGFEVKCFRGSLWITQHGDLGDRIIGRGESSRASARDIFSVTYCAPTNP